MNDTPGIDVVRLSLGDAHDLAPLVAAHAQDRKRGAPRRPDDFYAEMLLNDRAAELIGARLGDRMVGFALFFDLPETVTGMRIGQLEELFVVQDARGRGVARALVDALMAEGRRRGWLNLRWLVREQAQARDELRDLSAEDARLQAYVIPVERPAERR